jgi:hypothetical protein
MTNPSQCWICGSLYVTDYCTKCGPPEAWGPTEQELRETPSEECEHGRIGPCPECMRDEA